jgi:hypothetical protein
MARPKGVLMPTSNVLEGWGVETATISLFVAGLHKSSPSTLYHLAFGEEPNVSNELNNPHAGKLGLAQSLPEEGFVRSVQLQPGRIDIVLQAMLDPQLLTGPRGLGIEDAFSKLDRGARKILSASRDVLRIAVNARLTLGFEDLASANRKVEEILPYSLTIGDRRDFILQFNSRTQSSGLEFNRIMKWATESVTFFSGSLQDGFPTIPPSSEGIDLWVSVVHFDFNTVVPRPIFSRDEAERAIDTLISSVLTTRENNLRL